MLEFHFIYCGYVRCALNWHFVVVLVIVVVAVRHALILWST